MNSNAHLLLLCNSRFQRFDFILEDIRKYKNNWMCCAVQSFRRSKSISGLLSTGTAMLLFSGNNLFFPLASILLVTKFKSVSVCSSVSNIWNSFVLTLEFCFLWRWGFHIIVIRVQWAALDATPRSLWYNCVQFVCWMLALSLHC